MRSLPTPRLSGSLPSRVLGHLGDLNVVEFLLDRRRSQAKDGAISYRLVERAKTWYGETESSTFQVNMAGQRLVFTKDPAVYKDVLGPRQKHFSNSDAFRKAFGSIVPASMIVIEGEQWVRVRKVATKAIAMQQIDHLPTDVADTMDKLLRKLQLESDDPTTGVVTMDTHQAFPRATFDIFHKVMYKWDPDAVSNHPSSMTILNDAMVCAKAISDRILVPMEWFWRLPTADNKRAAAARDAFRANTHEFIAARTSYLNTADNDQLDTSLLDCMIVAARDGALTHDELVDQIQTFFFGSFDTTSHSISLLLSHLAQYPYVQDKLRAALQALFPDGKDSITSLDALDKCVYLDWVFNETMRLVPHAVGHGRTCIEPCVIQGYSFEKGDEIVVHSSAASLDRANYPGQTDLDQYRPDRFGEMALNKTTTLPFGFGGRMCPGRKIATGELKAICAYAVLGWKLSRPANLPFLMDVPVGLGMREGHGVLIWEPLRTPPSSS
ncbi:Aste57867_12657 [Aphanomyces stellatus]|uniref:Aste57867_12657 protein n=1 Tax=Aphanomyces stellatus TaxID=120398 RepID=A0A485KW70_9STRA|nr:hypothetical protein As57867_012611 [Aphanomyces stellatus]VFT89507.1 Aste57867_12657 [Aphanomyces stellatus]